MNKRAEFMCYVCESLYAKVPDKCGCGESLFIRIAHTIHDISMYKEKPKEEKDESYQYSGYGNTFFNSLYTETDSD